MRLAIFGTQKIRRALCPRGVLIPRSRLNFLFFIEGPFLAESHSPLNPGATFSTPWLDFFDFLADSGDL
jgi:hypothetical protein